MIITLRELLDILVMIAATGYIFMGIVAQRPRPKDVLARLEHGASFDWRAFRMSVLVTAPALIVHELAHKFVAMGFGLQATFHAAYEWLVIGIALKLLNTGFIFFIPGYVSLGSSMSPLQSLLIAGAGPLLNLMLWLGTWGLLTYGKWTRQQFIVIFMTRKINMWLFILNMLPLPFADGFKVYQGLWRVMGL